MKEECRKSEEWRGRDSEGEDFVRKVSAEQHWGLKRATEGSRRGVNGDRKCEPGPPLASHMLQCDWYAGVIAYWS